jgi:signal transduction histidine kinase
MNATLPAKGSKQLDAIRPGSAWPAIMQRFGGPAGALLTYLAVHVVLVWLGYSFKVSASEPAIIWPSVGLLAATLWLADLRYWPAFIAIHVVLEFVFGAALQRPFLPLLDALIVLSNVIAALVTVGLARRFVQDSSKVRTRQLLQLMLASAGGALVGAVFGAWANTMAFTGMEDYIHQIQLWWAGVWLGSLVVAPVVYCWCMPRRSNQTKLTRLLKLELGLIATLLAVNTFYVFDSGAGNVGSLLEVPIIMTALLLYAAYRLPLHWVATLILAETFLGAALASALIGPFIAPDPSDRTAQIQPYLMIAASLTMLVASALAEMRVYMNRLTAYARQIVMIEEQARRATAVDLHDGIAQYLVGMSMTLEAVRTKSSVDVRPLLDDVCLRLQEAQVLTRNLISDLSPPGLYELGLAPALEWLALRFHSNDQLQVQLDVQVHEAAIKLEIRVLVFKLVRELLRNVVKHANVDVASVVVRGNDDQLCVEIADQGRGFERPVDLTSPGDNGFGLWSIADRVRDAGGSITVDGRPGRGARFVIVIPLSTR